MPRMAAEVGKWYAGFLFDNETGSLSGRRAFVVAALAGPCFAAYVANDRHGGTV